MSQRSRTERDKKLARLTRGSSPHNAREAGVRFAQGEQKRAGRKRGVPNRITRDLREAIEQAAILSGYDGRGKDGLIGYLKRMADNDMRTFATMLRSNLPVKVEANVRHEKPYLTEAEVAAELKTRGLPPQTLLYLRYHEIPCDHFDPYDDNTTAGDLKPIESRQKDERGGGGDGESS